MGAIQTPHVSVAGARSQTPSASAPRLEFPLGTQIRSCPILFGTPLIYPGKGPWRRERRKRPPRMACSTFFQRGSVMTRGQNRPRWELSADFDSENPARSLPPGRRFRVFDPPSQSSVKSTCPGSLEGPAQDLDRHLHLQPRASGATSRNPPLAPHSGADGSPFKPDSSHRFEARSTSFPGAGILRWGAGCE